MGINVVNQTDSIGKTRLFRVRQTPFVVRWRAFQHELAVKATRLDFLTKISEIVAQPRQGARENFNTNSSPFQKSCLSNSIA
jgi:hypothetical protein